MYRISWQLIQYFTQDHKCQPARGPQGKVSMIHPLGTMNICTNFHGNQFNSYISVCIKATSWCWCTGTSELMKAVTMNRKGKTCVPGRQQIACTAYVHTCKTSIFSLWKSSWVYKCTWHPLHPPALTDKWCTSHRCPAPRHPDTSSGPGVFSAERL